MVQWESQQWPSVHQYRELEHGADRDERGYRRRPNHHPGHSKCLRFLARRKFEWPVAGESDHQSGPAQFEDRAGFPDTNSSDFPTGTIAFTDIATVFGSPPLNYQCADSSNPSATYTCPLPSCIVDADIEFNPKDTFSTAPTTPQNDFDLQAIATHEVGHLLGMDHSGLANAIMFAFGDTGGVPQRNLSVDDAIGIGSVYPSQKFAGVTGTLSGRVTLGGSGLFASHVVVMDATSGTAVTDTLTNMDGSYQIAVPQGQYHVIAIPLQGIYDLSDFGGWACGYNENAQPCCDPSTSTSCTGNLSNRVNTNFSGKFN